MKIEEQINQDGYVLMLSVGDSMQPMLHQRREQLLIEKIKNPLKKGDVVLYKRSSGQYVLHRIVKKKKECYIIRGDNRYINEKVYSNQIIGILNGFYRGEKYIDCQKNKLYYFYKVRWRLLYPFRFLFKTVIYGVKKILSKIKRSVYGSFDK